MTFSKQKLFVFLLRRIQYTHSDKECNKFDMLLTAEFHISDEEFLSRGGCSSPLTFTIL